MNVEDLPSGYLVKSGYSIDHSALTTAGKAEEEEAFQRLLWGNEASPPPQTQVDNASITTGGAFAAILDSATSFVGGQTQHATNQRTSTDPFYSPSCTRSINKELAFARASRTKEQERFFQFLRTPPAQMLSVPQAGATHEAKRDSETNLTQHQQRSLAATLSTHPIGFLVYGKSAHNVVTLCRAIVRIGLGQLVTSAEGNEKAMLPDINLPKYPPLQNIQSVTSAVNDFCVKLRGVIPLFVEGVSKLRSVSSDGDDGEASASPASLDSSISFTAKQKRKAMTQVGRSLLLLPYSQPHAPVSPDTNKKVSEDKAIKVFVKVLKRQLQISLQHLIFDLKEEMEREVTMVARLRVLAAGAQNQRVDQFVLIRPISVEAISGSDPNHSSISNVPMYSKQQTGRQPKVSSLPQDLGSMQLDLMHLLLESLTESVEWHQMTKTYMLVAKDVAQRASWEFVLRSGMRVEPIQRHLVTSVWTTASWAAIFPMLKRSVRKRVLLESSAQAGREEVEEEDDGNLSPASERGGAQSEDQDEESSRPVRMSHMQQMSRWGMRVRPPLLPRSAYYNQRDKDEDEEQRSPPELEVTNALFPAQGSKPLTTIIDPLGLRGHEYREAASAAAKVCHLLNNTHSYFVIRVAVGGMSSTSRRSDNSRQHADVGRRSSSPNIHFLEKRASSAGALRDIAATAPASATSVGAGASATFVQAPTAYKFLAVLWERTVDTVGPLWDGHSNVLAPTPSSIATPLKVSSCPMSLVWTDKEDAAAVLAFDTRYPKEANKESTTRLALVAYPGWYLVIDGTPTSTRILRKELTQRRPASTSQANSTATKDKSISSPWSALKKALRSPYVAATPQVDSAVTSPRGLKDALDESALSKEDLPNRSPGSPSIPPPEYSPSPDIPPPSYSATPSHSPPPCSVSMSVPASPREMLPSPALSPREPRSLTVTLPQTITTNNAESASPRSGGMSSAMASPLSLFAQRLKRGLSMTKREDEDKRQKEEAERKALLAESSTPITHGVMYVVFDPIDPASVLAVEEKDESDEGKQRHTNVNLWALPVRPVRAVPPKVPSSPTNQRWLREGLPDIDAEAASSSVVIRPASCALGLRNNKSLTRTGTSHGIVALCYVNPTQIPTRDDATGSKFTTSSVLQHSIPLKLCAVNEGITSIEARAQNNIPLPDGSVAAVLKDNNSLDSAKKDTTFALMELAPARPRTDICASFTGFARQKGILQALPQLYKPTARHSTPAKPLQGELLRIVMEGPPRHPKAKSQGVLTGSATPSKASSAAASPNDFSPEASAEQQHVPRLPFLVHIHDRIAEPYRLLLLGPTSSGKTTTLSWWWDSSSSIAQAAAVGGQSFRYSVGAAQKTLYVRVGGGAGSTPSNPTVSQQGGTSPTAALLAPPPPPVVGGPMLVSCLVTDLPGSAGPHLIGSHTPTADVIFLMFDYRDAFSLQRIEDSYFPIVCRTAPVGAVFVLMGHFENSHRSSVTTFRIQQTIEKGKQLRVEASKARQQQLAAYRARYKAVGQAADQTVNSPTSKSAGKVFTPMRGKFSSAKAPLVPSEHSDFDEVGLTQREALILEDLYDADTQQLADGSTLLSCEALSDRWLVWGIPVDDSGERRYKDELKRRKEEAKKRKEEAAEKKKLRDEDSANLIHSRGSRGASMAAMPAFYALLKEVEADDNPKRAEETNQDEAPSLGDTHMFEDESDEEIEEFEEEDEDEDDDDDMLASTFSKALRSSSSTSEAHRAANNYLSALMDEKQFERMCGLYGMRSSAWAGLRAVAFSAAAQCHSLLDNQSSQLMAAAHNNHRSPVAEDIAGEFISVVDGGAASKSNAISSHIANSLPPLYLYTITDACRWLGFAFRSLGVPSQLVNLIADNIASELLYLCRARSDGSIGVLEDAEDEGEISGDDSDNDAFKEGGGIARPAKEERTGGQPQPGSLDFDAAKKHQQRRGGSGLWSAVKHALFSSGGRHRRAKAARGLLRSTTGTIMKPLLRVTDFIDENVVNTQSGTQKANSFSDAKGRKTKGKRAKGASQYKLRSQSVADYGEVAPPMAKGRTRTTNNFSGGSSHTTGLSQPQIAPNFWQFIYDVQATLFKRKTFLLRLHGDGSSADFMPSPTSTPPPIGAAGAKHDSRSDITSLLLNFHSPTRLLFGSSDTSLTLGERFVTPVGPHWLLLRWLLAISTSGEAVGEVAMATLAVTGTEVLQVVAGSSDSAVTAAASLKGHFVGLTSQQSNASPLPSVSEGASTFMLKLKASMKSGASAGGGGDNHDADQEEANSSGKVPLILVTPDAILATLKVNAKSKGPEPVPFPQATRSSLEDPGQAEANGESWGAVIKATKARIRATSALQNLRLAERHVVGLLACAGIHEGPRFMLMVPAEEAAEERLRKQQASGLEPQRLLRNASLFSSHRAIEVDGHGYGGLPSSIVSWLYSLGPRDSSDALIGNRPHPLFSSPMRLTKVAAPRLFASTIFAMMDLRRSFGIDYTTLSEWLSEAKARLGGAPLPTPVNATSGPDIMSTAPPFAALLSLCWCSRLLSFGNQMLLPSSQRVTLLGDQARQLSGGEQPDGSSNATLTTSTKAASEVSCRRCGAYFSFMRLRLRKQCLSCSHYFCEDCCHEKSTIQTLDKGSKKVVRRLANATEGPTDRSGAKAALTSLLTSYSDAGSEPINGSLQQKAVWLVLDGLLRAKKSFDWWCVGCSDERQRVHRGIRSNVLSSPTSPAATPTEPNPDNEDAADGLGASSPSNSSVRKMSRNKSFAVAMANTSATATRNQHGKFVVGGMRKVHFNFALETIVNQLYGAKKQLPPSNTVNGEDATSAIVARWVSDDATSACPLCRKNFTFFMRRRHHCRACGTLCCGSCSEARQAIAGYLMPQRVCLTCESTGIAVKAQLAGIDSPREHRRGDGTVGRRQVSEEGTTGGGATSSDEEGQASIASRTPALVPISAILTASPSKPSMKRVLQSSTSKDEVGSHQGDGTAASLTARIQKVAELALSSGWLLGQETDEESGSGEEGSGLEGTSLYPRLSKKTIWFQRKVQEAADDAFLEALLEGKPLPTDIPGLVSLENEVEFPEEETDGAADLARGARKLAAKAEPSTKGKYAQQPLQWWELWGSDDERDLDRKTEVAIAAACEVPLETVQVAMATNAANSADDALGRTKKLPSLRVASEVYTRLTALPKASYRVATMGYESADDLVEQSEEDARMLQYAQLVERSGREATDRDGNLLNREADAAFYQPLSQKRVVLWGRGGEAPEESAEDRIFGPDIYLPM